MPIGTVFPETVTYEEGKLKYIKGPTQGVGQGHLHHEAPLIIIILNVVLLPFDDDILYKDYFARSFCSHFHHQQ